MPELLRRTSSRYKLILFLLSPLAVGYVIYRFIKDGDWNYFSQRLGFNYQHSSSRPILIHCASVGEVNAARPILSALRNQYPHRHIFVSTNTPTAARLIAKMQLQNITHVYLPLDYTVFVNAFLNHITPACVLVLETEIWPTLFLLSAKRDIPVAIINGRLTKKSMRAVSIIKSDYRNSLQSLTLLLTRSNEDRLKFIEIGAKEALTHAVGNLKYAIKPLSNVRLPRTTIKRPFLLAASTHDNEEIQLARHMETLRKKDYLLVIAPRYPDRSKKVAQQLRRENLKVAVHSKQNIITDDTNIYIVDTLGELDKYFNEATLVFVGGSLIPRGGHNILEPARFGKCILTGPHTENFALEIKELLQVNGIIQVSSNYELGVKLAHLLNNGRERARYGMNARRFIDQKTAVLKNYLHHLRPLIDQAIN